MQSGMSTCRRGLTGLQKLLLLVLFPLCHGVLLGDVLDELVVDLRQLLLLDGLHLAGKDGGLALEILGMILLGEGDVDVLLLAGIDTHQLLLEAGDEGVGADVQGLILGGAALEGHAVHLAAVIEDDPIPVLHGPIHVLIADLLLLLHLQSVVHFFVRHSIRQLLHGYTLVLAQRYVGLELDLGHVGDALGLAHDGDIHHGGTVHGDQLMLSHGGVVGLRPAKIEGLVIEDHGAVVGLNDLAGGFALAEAGHGIAAAGFMVGIVQRLHEGVLIDGDGEPGNVAFLHFKN